MVPEHQISVSPQLRAFTIPYLAQVAQVCPQAQRIEHNGQQLLALPHTDNVVRLLRNMQVPVPAPMLYQYNWANTRPFEHQRASAAFMALNPRCFNLSEFGTGKTRSTLYALDWLIKQGYVTRALVVAPLSTLSSVWEMEVFSCFPHLKTAVLHGGAEKRKKLLATDANIYIINHDGIGVVLDELTARRDIDCVIVDEIASFRNARSKRFRQLSQITRTRDYVWGLTGSPTPNEPTDAYGQIKLVSPERMPWLFKGFRNEVMQQVSMFRWVPRAGSQERVYRLMQPAVRYTRDDCLDLPPATYTTLDVGMSQEQQLAYDKMKKDFAVEYANGTITAANEGVKLWKMLQICGGFLYTQDDQPPVKYNTDPRDSELCSVIQQAQSKVIVFVPFVHLVGHVTSVVSKFGKAESVWGGVKRTDRTRIFYEFQNNVSTRFLVAHPETMAHGLTLTEASTIVWYLVHPSLEIYEQANARITRSGQKLAQHIVHLSGSALERRMFKALQTRSTTQGVLLSLFQHGSNLLGSMA